MKDYDSQEELSDSEDPDLLSELQDLDVDVGSTSHRQVRSVLRSRSFFLGAGQFSLRYLTSRGELD